MTKEVKEELSLVVAMEIGKLTKVTSENSFVGRKEEVVNFDNKDNLFRAIQIVIMEKLINDCHEDREKDIVKITKKVFSEKRILARGCGIEFDKDCKKEVKDKCWEVFNKFN